MIVIGSMKLGLWSHVSRAAFFTPDRGLSRPVLETALQDLSDTTANVVQQAVIAKLFRRHQARPLLNPGETSADVKKRILETVEDSNIVIALQMNHPERVKLIWEDI